ncbi:DUF1194 domain-containing protein [Yoonia sp. SS1-5]|uniref:DUF1194 domain-containing protein n=1 Tax=Yoonia rhodophyticola TaxID=3137370 RepID=A0AAN0MCU5_9RHOB
MRGVLLTGIICLSTPAAGCDVALMLAVDVSGSVDGAEYRIQMDGLAQALVDPTVTAALVAGNARLALMQWTGSGRQSVVIHWVEIANDNDVVGFATQVQQQPRLWRNFSTAIGEAMALSVAYFALVPECKRFVLDISGDGENNEGRVPRDVWDDLATADVTVNALVIEESVPGLTAYFESDVITGVDAFAVTANTFKEYPEQITRKLYRELTKAVAHLEGQ